MDKITSSSWSEIKSLDERLAREPDSFCFARLSEIYLKVGLVADALHTARQGVARHPGYLAGQRALAMACAANGLHEESRTLLEQVTAAVPEDTVAQNSLAGLYVAAGDKASAIRAYSTLLDFRPDDAECRARLDELHQADNPEPFLDRAPSEPEISSEKAVENNEEAVGEAAEEALEEDIYDLSEDDIVSIEEDASEQGMGLVAAPVAEVTAPDHHDPLSTLTLAELYEQQGFIAKALDIYRTLQADDPSNTQLQAKIASLETQDSTSQDITEQIAAPDLDDETEQIDSSEPEDESETSYFASSLIEDSSLTLPEPFSSAAFEDMPAPVEAQAFSPLAHNQADNVLGTLDSWLENIRRIKACR